MTTKDDALKHLEDYTLDKLYEPRARAINDARAAGATWREIAHTLNMTEAAVQRAPGVKSPWNDRKARP